MAIAQGQLTQNKVKSWMFNQIISIMTFVDNVGTDFDELVNRFRVDGSKYGDKKQYVSLDLPHTEDFEMDSQEALNVLATHRTGGKLEEITLDTFKRIAITSDAYITPLAFGNEGAFAQYNAALLNTTREAKKIHDSLVFDVALGCAESNVGSQVKTVALPTGDTAEATNRLQAQAIAKSLADIQTALKFPSTKFNDFGYMRSYNMSDFVPVFNAEWLNTITYMDKPTIYNDGFFTELGKYAMPADYFGTVKATGGTVGASNLTIRSMVEMDYVVSGTTYHVYPGDLLPTGAVYEAGEAYEQDDTIAYKLVHKDALPFMSALELSTQFVNAGNANSQNNYLFWAYNKPERLGGVPTITVRVSSGS